MSLGFFVITAMTTQNATFEKIKKRKQSIDAQVYLLYCSDVHVEYNLQKMYRMSLKKIFKN